MRRNLLWVYVLISGLLIGIALVVYLYGEYFGEDVDSSLSNGSNPIISQSVHGVVTRLATNTVGNPQQLSVTYSDLTSKKAFTFTVNDQYQSRFHVGDTVAKDKAEKVLLVYQTGGEMAIVPVD